MFKKFVSEQPFFFQNFASLRRCQGTLSRQMTFLSSVIFVYCLRSIEDNCTVPRVYCQTTLDKSQVYRTVFLGIAVATAVVWLPLSRPARSSFARRGKHLGEFRSGNTWGNLEVVFSEYVFTMVFWFLVLFLACSLASISGRQCRSSRSCRCSSSVG